MTGLPTLGTLPAGMAGIVQNDTSSKVISVALGSGILRWAPNSANCLTGLGGTGTWDSTTSNWCTVDNTKVPWIPGSTAVFPGSGGTVTVSGVQNIAGLDFQTSGMTITGSTLTGPGSVEALLTAGSGITATVSSVLAGRFEALRRLPLPQL